jgi:hypothetical protein
MLDSRAASEGGGGYEGAPRHEPEVASSTPSGGDLDDEIPF